MMVLVNSLSHHPRNEEIYQLEDIDDLMSSIEEVGLLPPLVVDQHKVDQQVQVTYQVYHQVKAIMVVVV